MTATHTVLILVVALVLAAVFWRLNWKFIDPRPAEMPIDPDEAYLVGREIAAAERLRREADAATDPEVKATLTRLADEAEGDIDKLRHEFDDRNG